MIGKDELIVDNFAGGGGASTGIERALGRHIDIAINHDREAIAMHTANHPKTRHLCEDVWKVDIAEVVAGRKVGLAWFSPDCKHFSKAKGGKPVEKKIRGLAWVALRWAGLVRPRIIMIENVEEFQDWGPLVEGMPCKRRKGMTFKRWCTQLRNLGYAVDWREMKACEFGAPTIRKRLFIVARRDGQRIVWPDATHGPEGNMFLSPYRTAAECIDWSIPCPSIFLTKEEGRAIGVNRPLADKTMARIARGVKRYVLDSARPYIVNITHAGAKRGEKALLVPTMVQTGYGEREGQKPRTLGIEKPLGTIVGSGKHALVSAFLAQHNAGPHNDNLSGRQADAPISTITSRGTQQQVVAAMLSRQFGNSVGSSANKPLGTVTAGGGGKSAVVATHVMKMRGKNIGSGADEPLHTISAGGTHQAEVRAFLLKYYGSEQDPRLEEPLHTVTGKDRFGLVTIHGEYFVIVDIGMRMLTPRELFSAQGFPDDYIIDRGVDPVSGEQIPLTKTAQVRMCGNSVSPPPAEALVRANFGIVERKEKVA